MSTKATFFIYTAIGALFKVCRIIINAIWFTSTVCPKYSLICLFFLCNDQSQNGKSTTCSLTFIKCEKTSDVCYMHPQRRRSRDKTYIF